MFLLAGAIGENPPQQLQRGVEFRSAGEGTDVARIMNYEFRIQNFVLIRLVCYENPRVRLAGDGDIKIILVIAHQHVVPRAPFFDELGFGYQRLDFCCGANEPKRRCLPKHLHDFRRFVAAVLKIRTQPRFQIRGLADVKRRCPPAEDVDAGIRGNLGGSENH